MYSINMYAIKQALHENSTDPSNFETIWTHLVVDIQFSSIRAHNQMQLMPWPLAPQSVKASRSRCSRQEKLQVPL